MMQQSKSSWFWKAKQLLQQIDFALILVITVDNTISMAHFNVFKLK